MVIRTPPELLGVATSGLEYVKIRVLDQTGREVRIQNGILLYSQNWVGARGTARSGRRAAFGNRGRLEVHQRAGSQPPS